LQAYLSVDFSPLILLECAAPDRRRIGNDVNGDQYVTNAFDCRPRPPGLATVDPGGAVPSSMWLQHASNPVVCLLPFTSDPRAHPFAALAHGVGDL